MKAITNGVPMPAKSATKPHPAAAAIDYDHLLERLGTRDRGNITRHLAACEEKSSTAHVSLWKRLACLLGALAPHALQTTGHQVVQFFIADGKYRRQSFAMEDHCDGKLVVYP